MSRSAASPTLGSLTLTGTVEADYAISLVRSTTVRVRVNLNQGDAAASNSKMPTPYNNLSLLAALDTDGVVHFYTVSEIADKKPMGPLGRGKKGPSSFPDGKVPENKLTECMSFSLEHEHMRSYDNVNTANIRIVDMSMDASEYSRIVLVSMDELGGVHTTVIGYQIFKGKTFVGQILPVDASLAAPRESKKKVPPAPGTADITEVDVGVNGEAIDSLSAVHAQEEESMAANSAAVGAEDSDGDGDGGAEDVAEAGGVIRRSEASVLTGEFDRNIEKYGMSPSKVNIVWGGAVSKKAAVPLDMLGSAADAAGGAGATMRPVSLLVVPNSLNSTRLTLADANRTNHIYAVGLSTAGAAQPGHVYPIVAFMQPDGVVVDTFSEASPALGGAVSVLSPFGILDLAYVPSDSMVVGITASSIHLMSTKPFTADARERKAEDFPFREGVQNRWSFGIHECLTRDQDESAEFYMMRQGGFKELVSVRVFGSRVLMLSVRMASGVVNLYHVRYEMVAPPASGDVERTTKPDGTTKDDAPARAVIKSRQYSVYYMGSVDPPYLPVVDPATKPLADETDGPASRLALFNFDQGRRSQLLMSSANSCGVGLFNISSPIRADSSDEIVFFRRNFAPNCFRAEAHANSLPMKRTGSPYLSGVEIFSGTSITSSTTTSGTKGGVSQAHMAPRKAPTTAAISKRRKPKLNTGGMTGGHTSKISVQSLVTNYNNLMVAYNHYNCTDKSSGGCDAAITGRVLFYEQLHNIDAHSTEQMAGFMKYGMYGLVIVAAIAIRFILKGFGGGKNKDRSGRPFRPNKSFSKKLGKGQFATTQANDDSEDDGLRGRYNNVRKASGGSGVDSEMQELIGRASHLQKLMDDAEQEVYRKKSAQKRGLGMNSTYPTGVGNSAYANKLRSELYDEPHKYQLSD